MQLTMVFFKLGEVLGKVLSVCGINGIYVTEKPNYMIYVYVLYISFMGLFGTVLTLIMKEVISRMLVKK